MKKVFLLSLLLIYLPAWAEPIPETSINHAWVDGVYWNQNELPGWGFFADVQEETLFGAIYGYLNGAPTFITLQGNVVSYDPVRFRGDVFSVTNGGSTATDVGNFTWDVFIVEASPAARLTISSNILNKSNLSLSRFSYAEDDKVDMFTAANWNVITRILNISFGDSFAIYDDRFEQDGVTMALVVDNSDTDEIGVVAYFPPGQGDFYAMGVEFDETTMEFFLFYASDTEMFGRGWLLEDGEEPSGNGYYFHGSADNFQLTYQEDPDFVSNSKQSASKVEAESDTLALTRQMDLKQSMVRASDGEVNAMFPEATVQSAFAKLSDIFKSRIKDKGMGVLTE